MSKETVGDDDQDDKEKTPSPADFAAYLPYACMQLDITTPLEITRVACTTETPSDRRARSTRASLTRTIATDSNASLNLDVSNALPQTDQSLEKSVKIICHYDKHNKLTGIEINKCTLPRDVLQIITLILVHQPQLQSITIKASINKYTLPDVFKIQQSTRLTEVCFDGTFVKEANYYLLLNENTMIRSMSLSRCKLNDEAIKMIIERISFPEQGSKTLQVLNLSSNCITDEGCKSIAKTIRTNRCLRYLNLADNQISDDGASAILSKMLVFPLSYDEAIEKRKRRFAYWSSIKPDEKCFFTTIDKLDLKSKSPTDKKKRGKSDPAPDVPMKDNMGYDPYDADSIIVKDNVCYSKGNNVLSYLNLGYNHLGYFSVVKLLKVLEHQRTDTMKDKGLIRVILNGNPIPRECTEMVEVDHMLTAHLIPPKRTASLKTSRFGFNILKK